MFYINLNNLSLKSLITACFIFLFLCYTGFDVYGQEYAHSKYIFKYLTMEDGLSNYKVNAICSDSSGFMWFGTNEGLNRFDGIKFRVFKHNRNDSSTISDNLVRKIIKTEGNRLIIATDGGVDIYDPKLESFSHLKCKDENE